MKIIGIIPARFASTRLPGKPLADLAGKTLIKRVFENAVSFGLDDVFVATDDDRIAEEIGEKALMTSSDLHTGTLRCAQAAEKMDADVIINIQGDEPFVEKEQIDLLANAFHDPEVEIATLCYHLKSPEALMNPASVKVVINKNLEALYFSRSPIPFVRNHEVENWTSEHKYLKHVGIYAFRRDILNQVAKLKQEELEKAESLEQLAWMENGYRIKVLETDKECFSIDTPEDLEKARQQLEIINKSN